LGYLSDLVRHPRAHVAAALASHALAAALYVFATPTAGFRPQ
jgi:hypothetical protein